MSLIVSRICWCIHLILEWLASDAWRHMKVMCDIWCLDQDTANDQSVGWGIDPLPMNMPVACIGVIACQHIICSHFAWDHWWYWSQTWPTNNSHYSPTTTTVTFSLLLTKHITSRQGRVHIYGTDPLYEEYMAVSHSMIRTVFSDQIIKDHITSGGNDM